jgi:RNase P subunit RPR2
MLSLSFSPSPLPTVWCAANCRGPLGPGPKFKTQSASKHVNVLPCSSVQCHECH